MNYNIIPLPFFNRQLKRLVKKYPSLKKEYENLIATLEKEPQHGAPLGNDCYKIRLAIASKGKGKSGGARVITLVIHTSITVYLLTIFDKSEQENISDIELANMAKGAISQDPPS